MTFSKVFWMYEIMVMMRILLFTILYCPKFTPEDVVHKSQYKFILIISHFHTWNDHQNNSDFFSSCSSQFPMKRTEKQTLNRSQRKKRLKEKGEICYRPWNPQPKYGLICNLQQKNNLLAITLIGSIIEMWSPRGGSKSTRSRWRN